MNDETNSIQQDEILPRKTILLFSSTTQFKGFSGEQVELRSETAATDGTVL